MTIERAEQLKREWTDRQVLVAADVPELRRFQGRIGTVRTVNMNCRLLVEFDGPADIGWYDIDPQYVEIPDEAQLEALTRNEAAAATPAAGKAGTAGKAQPAAAEKKPPAGSMSPLDRIRASAAGSGKGSAATAPSAAATTSNPIAQIRAQAKTEAAPSSPADTTSNQPDRPSSTISPLDQIRRSAGAGSAAADSAAPDVGAGGATADDGRKAGAEGTREAVTPTSATPIGGSPIDQIRASSAAGAQSRTTAESPPQTSGDASLSPDVERATAQQPSEQSDDDTEPPQKAGRVAPSGDSPTRGLSPLEQIRAAARAGSDDSEESAASPETTVEPDTQPAAAESLSAASDPDDSDASNTSASDTTTPDSGSAEAVAASEPAQASTRPQTLSAPASGETDSDHKDSDETDRNHTENSPAEVTIRDTETTEDTADHAVADAGLHTIPAADQGTDFRISGSEGTDATSYSPGLAGPAQRLKRTRTGMPARQHRKRPAVQSRISRPIFSDADEDTIGMAPSGLMPRSRYLRSTGKRDVSTRHGSRVSLTPRISSLPAPSAGQGLSGGSMILQPLLSAPTELREATSDEDRQSTAEAPTAAAPTYAAPPASDPAADEAITRQTVSVEQPVDIPDNLKVVEGVGPKIEGLLNEAGILTFRALAETPVDRLREILDAAGPRYRMHKPDTWPQQAGLAAEGRHDELKDLQDRLSAGRD